MSKPVISVENLSKSYQLGQIGTGTFSHDMAVWWARMRGKPNPLLRIGETDHGNRIGEELWALKDVSFQVEQGEVLGIIGRNGAGKSTLLKILSRVTAPTSGSVKVKGRIASLLEVGTGFHPELTGRENIYLNGAILGMSNQEIARKFDEIVEFSGVEKFIETPVKRYSSGMYVRLAFAVAAHLESEILLVDEVLAVGDAEFQKKCLGKMNDVSINEGRTVFFVSHNLVAIQNLCRKTGYFAKGSLINLSETKPMIEQYLNNQETNSPEYVRIKNISTETKKKPILNRISVKNNEGVVSHNIDSSSPVIVEIEYELSTTINNLRVGLRLVNGEGLVIFTSGDTDPKGIGTIRNIGIHLSKCHIPGSLLTDGKYYITATCDQPLQEIHFIHENIISFTISNVSGVGSSIPDKRLGIIRPSLEWEVS